MKKFLLILNLVLFAAVAACAESSKTKLKHVPWGIDRMTEEEKLHVPTKQSFHLITDEHIDIPPALMNKYEWITLFSPEHGVDNSFIPMPRSAADTDGDDTLIVRNMYTMHDFIKNQGEIIVSLKNDSDGEIRIGTQRAYGANRGYMMFFVDGEFSLVRFFDGYKIPLRFSRVEAGKITVHCVFFPRSEKECLFVFYVNDNILCAFTDVPPYGGFSLFRGAFLSVEFRGETKKMEGIMW